MDTVLVCHRDQVLARYIQAMLTKNYICWTARSLRDLLDELNRQKPKVPVLVLGSDFVSRVRLESDAPILGLIDSGPDNIVLAMEGGADMVMTVEASQQHHCRELNARIKALLRRLPVGHRDRQHNGYRDNYIAVDFNAHKVMAGDNPVKVTPGEWLLLCLLISRVNQALSKEFLCSHLTPAHGRITHCALRQLARGLRDKIARAGRDGTDSPIITIRGYGYMYAGKDLKGGMHEGEV